MVTDYMSYALDATTYEMIVIAKLQMLAWGVYDGTVEKVRVTCALLRRRRWTAALSSRSGWRTCTSVVRGST